MNGFNGLPSAVQRALARAPYDADERARGLEQVWQADVDEVRTWAAVERARVAIETGEVATVIAWCDRAIAHRAPVAAIATAVVLRAAFALLIDEASLDRAAVADAAEVLETSGRWEDAMTAHGILADDAATRDDLAGARREYARAVGCAEAGSGRRLGPGYLIALAHVETRLGDPRQALGHLEHALARLEHVMLLGARLAEADAYEALGTAYATLHEPVHAATAWREAMARYERLEMRGRAEAVRAKR